MAIDEGRPQLARRGFLAGAGGALVAGLSACASGGARSGNAPPSRGFPVQVPNKHGTAEIPTAPERVVTLGITDHDAALALGVVPVGLNRWGPWDSGVGPWSEPLLRGQRPEQFTNDPDPEAVIRLAPDVVTAVQSALTANRYAKLDRFAPVVAQPPGTIDYGVEWRQQVEILGRALGKSEEAARVIEGTRARIDGVRRDNPSLQGKTHVTVQTSSSGEYAAYTKQDPRTRLLEELGLPLSPAVEQLGGEQFSTRISRERVSLLDADVVIVTTPKSTDVAAARADPLLNDLPAAKRGGLLLLDDYDLTMALGSATATSIPYVIDKLVPQLVSALRR